MHTASFDHPWSKTAFSHSQWFTTDSVPHLHGESVVHLVRCFNHGLTHLRSCSTASALALLAQFAESSIRKFLLPDGSGGILSLSTHPLQ
jgi:hypothetical protein